MVASPKTTAGVSKSPKTPKGPKTFVKSPPQAPQKPKRRGMVLQSPPKVQTKIKPVKKHVAMKARKPKSKEGKKPMKVATIDRWVRHLDKTVKEETCVVVHTFKEDKVALASCPIRFDILKFIFWFRFTDFYRVSVGSAIAKVHNNIRNVQKTLKLYYQRTKFKFSSSSQSQLKNNHVWNQVRLFNGGGLLDIEVVGKDLRAGHIYMISYKSYKNVVLNRFAEDGDPQARLVKSTYLTPAKKAQQCLKIYTLCD